MDIKDRRALTPDRLRKEIDARIDSPVSLHDWLRDFLPWIVGPSITSFTPTSGRPGCRVDIDGARFSTTREDNTVEVGNRPALVVAATANRLTVVTDAEVTDGPVKVTVGGKTAVGPQDFSVLGYPDPLAGEDGPPIAFSGAGPGSAGDVNPIGTVRVLVALVRPNDLTPGNAATTRQAVVDAWDDVRAFYTQASYGRTDVQVDVTAGWRMLDGAQSDFVSTADQNIIWGQIDRITAQAAQGAVDEGFDLDDYAMMATVMFLNGTFIRVGRLDEAELRLLERPAGGRSEPDRDQPHGEPRHQPHRHQ